MRRLAMKAAAAAMMVLLGAAPALARPLPSGGLTRQEVAAWLEGKGYDAEIHTGDRSGEVIITSKISDVNYDIFFYGCARERCTSVEFLAGWTPADAVTLTELNAWNAKRRYAFGYRDDEENLWVQIDVDLAPGGSWELLDANLSRWGDVVASYKSFVDSGGTVE